MQSDFHDPKEDFRNNPRLREKWEQISEVASQYSITGDPENVYRMASMQSTQNIPHGQCILGFFLKNGIGVESDYDRSYLLMKMASDGGCPEAMYFLSGYYSEGCVVDQCFQECARLMKLASDNGCTEALYDYGSLLSLGVLQKCSEEGLECIREAAERGNVKAQMYMGRHYKTLEDGKHHYGEMLEWFDMAADNGDMYGIYEIACCMDEGTGVVEDPEGAFRQFLKSAEMGYSAAQYRVGRMYERGRGIVKSKEKAVEWFLRSADRDTHSKESLLKYYEQGYDIEQSEDGSVRLIERFSKEDNPEAYSMFVLSRLYDMGMGVKMSKETGQELLKLARKKVSGKGCR